MPYEPIEGPEIHGVKFSMETLDSWRQRHIACHVQHKEIRLDSGGVQDFYKCARCNETYLDDPKDNP